MNIWVCVLLLFAAISGSLSQETVRRQLQSSVILTCEFGGVIDSCQWTGPQGYIIYGGKYTDKNPLGYTANALNRSCSLRIVSFQAADRGEWTCTSPDQPNRKVVKLVAVTFPYIGLRNNGGSEITGRSAAVHPDENYDANITCESFYGIPLPNDFTWKVDGVTLKHDDIRIDNTHKQPVERSRSYGVLTLHFSPPGDEKKEIKVECIIHQDTYDTGMAPPLSTVVGLAYATSKVKLTKNIEDPTTIECVSNGLPRPGLALVKNGDNWNPVPTFLGFNYTAQENATFQCRTTSGWPNYIKSKEVDVIVNVPFPQETIKKEANAKVIIPCDLGGAISFCQWNGPQGYVVYGGKYVDLNPAGYTIGINTNTGKCTLWIDALKDIDNGIWICSSRDRPGPPNNRNRRTVNLLIESSSAATTTSTTVSSSAATSTSTTECSSSASTTECSSATSTTESSSAANSTSTTEIITNGTAEGLISAIDGSAAILPCRLAKSLSERLPANDKLTNLCFWIHDDSTTIFSHRPFDTPGYQILSSGSDNQQCDLVIYQVRKQDQGNWYCTRGYNPRQKVQLKVTDRVNGHQPDVLAIQGTSVVLPCQTRNTNDICFWAHGTDVVLNNNIQDSIRYGIISDPKKGNCNLFIRSVQREDTGNWFCHIFGNPPKKVELGVSTLG